VLAIQCPEAEHYHVQAEAVLVEIVDDGGRACPPGAVGRVVVTPLHNFATPLIRYHVGDYALAGDECACGRGLPVISRVMGRTRNMVRLPDGASVFPSLDPKALTQIAPLRQIQLVQKTLAEIEANLVATRPLNAAETVRLGAAVGRMLGHPFPLRLVYMDEIPRAASGKYEDFRSELTA
jgi:phenylacetate-CoA ligase